MQRKFKVVLDAGSESACKCNVESRRKLPAVESMAAEESLCKFNRVNELRKKGCLIHPNVSREISFATLDKPHRHK